MGQFSLKRMMLAVACFAVACGSVSLLHHPAKSLERFVLKLPDGAGIMLIWALWLTTPAFFGSAFGILSRSAVVGFTVAIAAFPLLVLLFAFF
jgi:hypothetical protein